jgi:hypothetical protein
MPFAATDRMMWAAKSPVPLREACARVQERLGLAPFRFDCEAEGDDSWSYGTSQNALQDVNLTVVGSYHNPAIWSWMWGAPDQANYQVVITWDYYGQRPDLRRIERELGEILGCELVRCPGLGEDSGAK